VGEARSSPVTLRHRSSIVLVQAESQSLTSDVLKLGHHGSKFSSSTEYLKAVSPALGLISAGIDNKYGHPNQETLGRLQDLAHSLD